MAVTKDKSCYREQVFLNGHKGKRVDSKPIYALCSLQVSKTFEGKMGDGEDCQVFRVDADTT